MEIEARQSPQNLPLPAPGSPATPYTIIDFVDTFSHLLEEIERIEYCRRDLTLPPKEGAQALLKGTKVLDNTKTLLVIAEQFKNDICFPEEGTSRAEVVEEKGIPYFMLSQIVDVLNKVSINRRPEIKRELSKVAHIFAEIVVFQSQLQPEADRFDIDSAKELSRKLKKSRDTLHKSRIETYYHLKCAREAIGMLELGAGKLKELRRRNLAPVLQGAFSTLISANPGGANLAPLTLALFDLMVDVYKMLKERDYQEVWALRWYPLEGRITRLEDFNKIYPLMENYKANFELSICIAEIFSKIIKSNAEKELKKWVFSEGDGPTMKKLVKHKKFWEVRSHALDLVGDLPLDEGDDKIRCQLILDPLVDPKEKALVRKTAHSIAQGLSPESRQKCRSMAEEMKIPKKAAEARAFIEKAEAAGNSGKKLRKELEELQSEEEKLNERLSQQTSSEGKKLECSNREQKQLETQWESNQFKLKELQQKEEKMMELDEYAAALDSTIEWLGLGAPVSSSSDSSIASE